MKLTPIAKTLTKLGAGEVTSARLVEDCLEAIGNPQGEGARAFIYVDAKGVRAAANAVDATPVAKRGLLGGLPISIKDLFDVAGEQTLAGSVALKDDAPKTHDAIAMERLRRAGAIFVGRTNMTEFAFSGLGINLHYGTPLNPWDRKTGRIPGGSSSGAAVSVTDGMAHAAIGSDTGGSVRIPSALCGLVGFKPTAKRVPLEGAFPLSPSLDSIGPLAPTVECCALLDAVMADEPYMPLERVALRGLRLGVLQGYVMDGVQTPVAAAFDAALQALAERGAKISDIRLEAMERVPQVNAKGGIVVAEAYAVHRKLMETRGDVYDPRVRKRILEGEKQNAADYIDVLWARREIQAAAAEAFAEFDAVLLPTLPVVAPAIAELEASFDAYLAANRMNLRNPSLFNFLDGCALSVPCHKPGEAPVGLMVAQVGGEDRKILRVGAAIERALAEAGCAVHCEV